MTVTAAPLERVELTRTISMSGSVHSWQDVIISSEVGGYRVNEVLVDVGDHVRKGQRLVSLSTACSKPKSRRSSDVDHARPSSRMQRRRSSARILGARNLLSKADLDRLLSEQLASQSRLESARADLETSQLRLSSPRS